MTNGSSLPTPKIIPSNTFPPPKPAITNSKFNNLSTSHNNHHVPILYQCLWAGASSNGENSSTNSTFPPSSSSHHYNISSTSAPPIAPSLQTLSPRRPLHHQQPTEMSDADMDVVGRMVSVSVSNHKPSPLPPPTPTFPPVPPQSTNLSRFARYRYS